MTACKLGSHVAVCKLVSPTRDPNPQGRGRAGGGVHPPLRTSAEGQAGPHGSRHLGCTAVRLWCEHLTLGLGGQEGHGKFEVTCRKGTEKASLNVAQRAMCQINQESSFLKKKKIKIELRCGPSTLLLGTSPNELNAGSWTEICTPMLTAALQ